MSKKHKKKDNTSFIQTEIKISCNEALKSENNIKKESSINSIGQINPHKIIWGISSVLFLILASFYSFVYGSASSKDIIETMDIISKDIYIDSPSKDNVIIYKSEKSLSGYTLSSSCNIEQKFIKQVNSYHIFYFKFKDSKCRNPYLFLKNNDDKILSSLFSVNFIDDFSLLNKLTDYKSDELRAMKADLVKKLEELDIYKNSSGSLIKNIAFLEKNKEYKNTIYLKSKINYILEQRGQTYLIPVSGYSLAKRGDRKMLSAIPNSGRPYRLDTTDGIHHGWDIMAPIRTPVRALSDGLIIRVVNGFKFEDINKKLKKGPNLSYEDKMYNLDVFRGNQIWIKTMKGDIIFYSHLDSINPEIKEGAIINAGNKIGKIGISGVPDKAYTNYHLHFEIAKNPKIFDRAGTYVFDEIMKWPWEGKGLTNEQIFDFQDKNFKK